MEKTNKHESSYEEPNFTGKLDVSDSRLKQSVFLSKYFPAIPTERTHLFWKLISGMNPHEGERLGGHNDSSSSTNSVDSSCFLLSSSHTTSVSQPAQPHLYPSGNVDSRHQTPSQNISGGGEDKQQYLLNSSYLHHQWDGSEDVTPVDFVGVHKKISTSMAGQSGATVSSTVLQYSQQASNLTGDPEVADQKTGSSRSSVADKTECEIFQHADRCQQEEQIAEEIPHSTVVPQMVPSDTGMCQVCEDVAAGFYCGAFVCEACKKFFIRASKQEKLKFVCLRQGMCKITKESRVQCQYCRYQKCLQLHMYYPGEGKRSVSSPRVSGIPCRVCGAPSSGFHFGALTCEGCKGFFRRMVKERDPGIYKCSTGDVCQISTYTRNMCKACRYKKCINIGMSVEGSRIGRQPNAVKHAISLEVKKQCSENAVLPVSASAIEPCGLSSSMASTSLEANPQTSNLASTPTIIGSHPMADVEVKAEDNPILSLTDMELSEVPAEVNMKQEPQDEEFEEQLMTSSLQLAGKELAHMCLVERAKSNTFDEAVFQSLPSMWKRQMKHFEFHAQCVLRFAKKVPGFRQLLLDDQVVLVQNAIYPIVILNHSRSYEMETGFYNYFNFNKQEEQAILESAPEFSTLQDHFKHVGMMAKTMKMTDMEYTLLSCVLLFNAECPGVEAVGPVEKLQDRILHFFQVYESKTYANGMSRFGEMMLRISELILASTQHMQAISSFLLRHPHLEIPQLYREMFL